MEIYLGFVLTFVPKVSFSTYKQAGYTMIEVMTVVLIMAITASVGLPLMNSSIEDSKLSGAGEEVITALEYARLNAMLTGTPTRVTVDTVADTVLVEQFKSTADLLNEATTEIPEGSVEAGAFAPMEHPLRRGVDYSISIAEKNWLGAADITTATFGTGNSVVFEAQGTPSNGGTVHLAFGTRQAVINVDALSGTITLSD